MENVFHFFYNIAQGRKEIFCVDIHLYQDGTQPMSVQNLEILYYNNNHLKTLQSCKDLGSLQLVNNLIILIPYCITCILFI